MTLADQLLAHLFDPLAIIASVFCVLTNRSKNLMLSILVTAALVFALSLLLSIALGSPMPLEQVALTAALVTVSIVVWCLVLVAGMLGWRRLRTRQGRARSSEG